MYFKKDQFYFTGTRFKNFRNKFQKNWEEREREREREGGRECTRTIRI